MTDSARSQDGLGAGEAMEGSSPAHRAPGVVDDRPRWKLTLAYDGTEFHGWQKQTPPAGAPLRTVGGVVEQVLTQTLRQPITLVGASRTDAGVHALGQVAHFNADSRIPLERMARAIDSRLPEDVIVRSIEPADAGFDAISDARCKQYRYRFDLSDDRPLTSRRYVWHCDRPVEVEAMSAAAGRLVGEHDFAGFAQINHGRSTTVRTIVDCRIERPGEGWVDGMCGAAGGGSREVHLVVVGTGFLYNMVRIIAGTVLDIGLGRRSADSIDEALSTGDRRAAGPTLGPQGLWLEWIRYDRVDSRPPEAASVAYDVP